MNNIALKIFAAGFVLILMGAVADGQSTQPDDAPGLPTTRASMDVISHIQKQLHGISSVESDFVEHKKLAMLDHTLVDQRAYWACKAGPVDLDCARTRKICHSH